MGFPSISPSDLWRISTVFRFANCTNPSLSVIKIPSPIENMMASVFCCSKIRRSTCISAYLRSWDTIRLKVSENSWSSSPVAIPTSSGNSPFAICSAPCVSARSGCVSRRASISAIRIAATQTKTMIATAVLRILSADKYASSFGCWMMIAASISGTGAYAPTWARPSSSTYSLEPTDCAANAARTIGRSMSEPSADSLKRSAG